MATKEKKQGKKREVQAQDIDPGLAQELPIACLQYIRPRGDPGWHER